MLSEKTKIVLQKQIDRAKEREKVLLEQLQSVQNEIATLTGLVGQPKPTEATNGKPK